MRQPSQIITSRCKETRSRPGAARQQSDEERSGVREGRQLPDHCRTDNEENDDSWLKYNGPDPGSVGSTQWCTANGRQRTESGAEKTVRNLRRRAEDEVCGEEHGTRNSCGDGGGECPVADQTRDERQ
ncbi:hypothetical protein GN958_ATG17503 [Phytophthora infestans]|uniref:Uncharacterized protein n=1 Tax=Phytophthora infestans TaxID=4787 RepID=A0A8S9U1W0_PHYIN|nr:hypothetical protein GN958_ATG17503 [Phytophthora infestans]